jgi:hypothetical protein
MAQSMQQKVEDARSIAGAVSDLAPDAQAAIIQAAIPTPTGEAINRLWMTLVQGLLLALLVALGGLLYLLIDDKSADVAVTVFTALLTGLLGLFAPSPTSSSGQSG